MFPDLLRDDVFRLETPRLWLRWPRAADASALSRLAGDPNVARMTTSVPHPYTEPDAARWIFSSRAGNAQGSSLALVMARRAKPNEAIGVVALHQTRPGVALLGCWVGAPHQRCGLGTEAVAGVIDLAFQVADVEDIHAQALADNDAARQLLAGRGFRSEGRAQVDLPQRGGVLACERFRQTREAWSARTAGVPSAGETVVNAVA